MRIITQLFSFIAFILIINIPSLQATMVLDKMIVHFKPGKRWEDIIVTNPDKEPLYLQVSAIKIKNPGTSKETKTVITKPEEMELLVSPQKATIPANGRQTVRIAKTVLQSKDKEIVYRVAFVPVSGKVKSNQNAIKILVSYQALIFLQPDKPFIQVACKPGKQSLECTNTGNVNVLLHQGKYCSPQLKGKKQPECTDLGGSRIYAGESWTVKLPENVEPTGHITFSLQDGTAEHQQKFHLSKSTVTPKFNVL